MLDMCKYGISWKMRNLPQVQTSQGDDEDERIVACKMRIGI